MRDTCGLLIAGQGAARGDRRATGEDRVPNQIRGSALLSRPGGASGFADGGVDGRRRLCTSWLRQRPSVERSLRTECAANGVQFAAECRAATSSVGGLSAMPGERHLARKAPSLSGSNIGRLRGC